VTLFATTAILGMAATTGSGSTTVIDDHRIPGLEATIERQQDTADRLIGERDTAYAQIDQLKQAQADAQTDLDAQQADLDERASGLDDRETGLDTREGEITGAEAAAEANSFGNGTYVVGTDIQPGTYRSDGPTPDAFGMGYWARLSGLGGTLDEIITNALPEGPATVTISASDTAFESTGMQTWTKIG
jgi:hypothetical protein